MIYPERIITAPAAEPVSLAEAKAHLRITSEDDDAYIQALITAARIQAENQLWRHLVNTTVEITLHCWPSCSYVELLPDVASITSLTYYNEAGAPTVWSSSNYALDAYALPSRLVLATSTVTWPATTTLRTTAPILVRFVAGFGAAAANVPQPIRQALLLLIEELYDGHANHAATVGALLGPYEVRW